MSQLRDLVAGIDDPRREAILAIYDEYADLFHYAKGSGHNHQAWPGGYADHIAECLRINTMTYKALNEHRPLPFTEASAAICLFFHDIEKPFRYGPEGHNEAVHWRIVGSPQWRSWEEVKWMILNLLRTKHPGLRFSLEEMNALKYTHGEGGDHRKDRRIASPLAAHVHHCDNISARIWHDEGQGLSE